jgi:sec-independent protein translocase protein TatB
VVGLLVLGPERLPVAIRTVSRMFRTVRDTANAVKTELAQELRMEELHRDLKKAEQLDMKNLSPELQESIDQLKDAAASVTRPYEKTAAGNTGVHGAETDTPPSKEPQDKS